MGKETDCLYGFLELYMIDFIEQDRKQDGKHHGEHQLSHCNNKGISENPGRVRQHQHMSEIIQTHPPGLEEAQYGLKILECHDISEKRDNCINKQHQKARKHQQMILVGLSERNLPAGLHFFHILFFSQHLLFHLFFS